MGEVAIITTSTNNEWRKAQEKLGGIFHQKQQFIVLLL